MTPRERFLSVLDFEKPDDRLPMVEWAAWWNQTLDRWKTEGLPQDITWDESLAHFGLDPLVHISAVPRSAECPKPASHGAGIMSDERSYDEFISPYYQQLVPHIKAHGAKVLVDSDGDVTEMIPWLTEAGIDGVYPLERQAGVDIAVIRARYPRSLMMGGYDKMVMSKGEAEMRQEFERLLPVMRTGGYIPSVDHQTPPEVSLENYRIYVRLFDEFVTKAAQ